MTRRAIVGILAAACMTLSPTLGFGQQAMSEESMQASSQESSQQSSEDSLQQSSEQSSQQSTDQSSQQTTQESSQQSSEQSSQNSTDNSFQWSTDETTVPSSQGSSQQTTESSAQSEGSSIVVLTIAGAAVAIGLTVLGVVYLVHVKDADQENVLSLQDEIYAASGTEYAHVLDTFGIPDAVLVRANDEIAAGGFAIDSDRDAAEYLVKLVLGIADEVRPMKIKLSESTTRLPRAG